MPTDVVLLKDVERLGSRGALVKVKPGFARNYLLPRGLAALATPAQRRVVEEAARQQAHKTQRAREQAEALKQRLEARPVTLTLALGADGKSFGAVTAHDIAEALARDGVTLEKHAVRLDQPLKALGTHEVAVRVHPDVSATVKIVVVKA